MRVIISASPTEDFDADVILLDLTAEDVQNIRATRAKCIKFLKKFDNYMAYVELYFGSLHAGCLHDDAPNNLQEWSWDAKQGDYVVVDDTFELKDSHAVRIECHTIAYAVSGDIYLKALSKYGSDRIFTELTPKLLNEVATAKFAGGRSEA